MTQTLREIIGYDSIYEDFIEMVKATSIMTMSDEDIKTITQLSEESDDFDTKLEEYAAAQVDKLPSSDEMWLLVEDYISINVSEEELQKFVDSSNIVADTLIGVGDFMSTIFKKNLNVTKEQVH